MYFLSVLIIILTGILVYKSNDVKQILAIVFSALVILLIENENNFYEIGDFLAKYSLLNITVIVFISLLIFLIYWCYKNKRLDIVFLCSVLFIKWLPLENNITLILSAISLVFIFFKYRKLKKLNLYFVSFLVLSLHIVHENNFKPTRLPIVGIGNVRVYESININEIKKLDSFKSIYIMPTSLFKANNFPLIIHSLYTYSKTDYCLLKTYNNLYNCSFFNIDARKKQRFYKKYGKIQEDDYLQLGKMLVENKVPELELKKYYLDNKQKLILIGMLTVYNNYRYIYSDCDLYKCSNKKIEDNKITTECFINKCNDNDFIIKMKDEMLAFIEKNSIKGEVLSFNITNTEEISN